MADWSKVTDAFFAGLEGSEKRKAARDELAQKMARTKIEDERYQEELQRKKREERLAAIDKYGFDPEQAGASPQAYQDFAGKISKRKQTEDLTKAAQIDLLKAQAERSRAYKPPSPKTPAQPGVAARITARGKALEAIAEERRAAQPGLDFGAPNKEYLPAERVALEARLRAAQEAELTGGAAAPAAPGGAPAPATPSGAARPRHVYPGGEVVEFDGKQWVRVEE